ncbi:TPA: inositol monophosphatase [Serratia odorifera]|jgi:myo-inositol-1(or 4)-monophosphatase|uniref:inositol monophosphatase family protein n=1 Tax=Serratia odorifera TaxID=618 RepID=UPI0018E8106E|nr:inositol monophosphatase family protein [Serratia odorifera]MBJ2067852.1 inositol monophosphatase [Serratia odorifera]HEJ9096063.1 inositol monophosphatase [Serratia odorifera]
MTATSAQDISARYHFACDVARQAAELAYDFYQRRQQLAVEHKGDDLQDVVSQADREVEALTRRLIAQRFPLDDFLGEESGGSGGSAACTWVVDPIDGTACFLNGLHTWCVSIGVIVDGDPVIGVVYDPNHREMFHACKGQGAFLNHDPIRVHAGSSLRDGVMGVGTSHRVTPEDFVPFISRLLHAGGMFIRSGSGALMTAQVAAGRLIGYYEPHMNAWDSLPGIVLVREAGGVSNDFLADHGLQRGNVLLMANAEIYSQLSELIQQKIK